MLLCCYKHPQISATWGLLLTLGGVIQDLQPQTGSNACYEMKLCRKPRTLGRVECCSSSGTSWVWEMLICTTTDPANVTDAAGEDAKPGSGKTETSCLLSRVSSHVIVEMSQHGCRMTKPLGDLGRSSDPTPYSKQG